jgi:FMN-dependent NADH-azoreductase
MGERSISRSLTREFVQRWRSANPRGKVVTRDLATMAIPPIDATWIAANMTPRKQRTERQNQILRCSSELTGELLEADEFVIGIAMHNWGPATSFKLWVDQIVRFEETITLTPSGPKGILGNKRATFCVAAGRKYGPGSDDAQANYLAPWLRTFFGYLGIEDMHFVFADGAAAVTYGKLDRASFLAPYVQAIDALFAGAT